MRWPSRGQYVVPRCFSPSARLPAVAEEAGSGSLLAANLYVSIRFPVSGGFAALGGLSLAVGVVVAQALQELDPSLPVGLKWPNDLQINGAKVGGVLIELAGEMDGQVDVVIGVGVNGCMTGHQARDIDQTWTDLASELADMPPRTVLAGCVLTHLLDMLPRFSQQGFAAFRETLTAMMR